jgi:hypothetical protein
MSDEEQKALQSLRERKREGWFSSEENKQRLASMDDLEPTYECPKRIGIRFVPHTDSKKLRLVTVLCCEDRNNILLRCMGEESWACPDCDLRVEREVADILARESIKALERFRKAGKKRERRKWWPWRNWFRSKKSIGSSGP